MFLFFSELIVVKIDHVSVLANNNKTSIWVRPAVSYFGWLCKTEGYIAYDVTFWKKDGADYALGLLSYWNLLNCCPNLTVVTAAAY